MQAKVILATLVLLLTACAQTQEPRIGIITDLTGPASYWGESTRIGAELAAEELAQEGKPITLIFEDYKLDAPTAASAAQKLVTIDEVDAVYIEFNPGTVAASAALKDTLHVYAAAITSPLESENAYKTYLDYKQGCKALAEEFKSKGTEIIGVLKINLELGTLCLQGVQEVYPNALVESYNLGDSDLRTQLLKMDEAQAVINVGFEGDTINALKVKREQHMQFKYGTVADTLTKQVREEYADELMDGYSFGFQQSSSEFREKIGTVSSYNAAALAYTHIKQLGNAIYACDRERTCEKRALNNAPPDPSIGFNGFQNRVAALDIAIEEN
jgi:ABC-type branched-subunit amino acid transport system substrate-binding protein